MIHLHRHSEFSRLDGVGTAEQYAARAAEMEQPGLGLTDHGTLSGLLHHIKACKGKDGKGNKIHEPVVPICGVEAYYRPDRSIRDKSNSRAWHLCFWAKNLTGWHNLLRLTSIAYRDSDDNGGGFYGKPCVDLPLMRKYSEGVICSTACITGWLSYCILNGDDSGANEWITDLKEIYKDDLWLEIMPHDFDDQRTTNLEIVNLGYQHGLGVLMGVDAHVPLQEETKTQQVAKLLSIKSTYKKQGNLEAKQEEEGIDPESFAKLLPTVYLMEEQEVRDLCEEAHPDLPEEAVDEAIANTHEILKSTTPFMLSKRNKLPRVSESPEESEETLREWVEEGMERIAKYDPPEAWEGTKKELEETRRERLEYEFGVLKEKGVIDYFILVGDFIRWCKSQKIRTTCRGSAAGCFISYLIGISPIDPIAWGLLFERFLNPGRKGLPDIDIDIQSDRRDEAKAYLSKKYGRDYVADIISHATFQPKAVLLAVARVFDVPYTEVEELNKTIEIKAEDDETTLEELRPINEKLDAFAKKYPEVYEHALRLEGTVENASKHAAGIVITDRPVADYMPLERGKKGDQVTSWSDRANFPVVSDYGFVKLDALGVKGLSKQDMAVQLIKERHGVDLDLEDLPIMRDPSAVEDEVMEIFKTGRTLGVWQFASRGMMQLLKSVEPEWGGDIAALNALYRPGAMGSGMTWEYAERKENPDAIDYWHESIVPIMSETFGIIAYQEQVMEICKQLGGFSGGQADDMRKAMGKLYRLPGDEAKRYMEGYKSTWDKGIKAIGLSQEEGDHIFEMILSFGGYGFNKSHAACYAVQAYQDAYLKAHFPPEFYIGLLHNLPSTLKSAKEKAQFKQAVFREAADVGVEVGPPDINTSGEDFALDGNTVRFGISSIKDVGPKAAEEIMEKRPFWNFKDFKKRTVKKTCNAKVERALIEAGALDRWNMRDELPGQEISRLERERLGVSLTIAGDIKKYEEELTENVFTMAEFEDAEDGDEIIVGGDVIDTSTTKVKKGKTAGAEMGFVNVLFGPNEYRLTFFPELWKRYQPEIESGAIMVVGKKNTYRGDAGIVVNACKTISDWASSLEREGALL